jgi:hypothetical protein
MKMQVLILGLGLIQIIGLAVLGSLLFLRTKPEPDFWSADDVVVEGKPLSLEERRKQDLHSIACRQAEADCELTEARAKEVYWRVQELKGRIPETAGPVPIRQTSGN